MQIHYTQICGYGDERYQMHVDLWSTSAMMWMDVKVRISNGIIN